MGNIAKGRRPDGWPRASPAYGGLLFPGAVAAYSLRQLRSGYPTFAVNVRRSSDNATQDVGFVNGDFDLATFNAFIGGGSGFVTRWYDQSGNGNDAIQTTAANQPQLVTGVAALNGRAAILIGDGSAFTLGAFPSPTIADIFAAGGYANSVVTVNTATPATAGDTIWQKGPTFLRQSGTTLHPLFQINATTPGFWTSNAALSVASHIVDVQYSSASLSNVPVVAVDGTSQTFSGITQPLGTISSDAALSLRLGGTGSAGWSGHLAEMLFYKTQPAAGPLRANQKAYWGTP